MFLLLTIDAGASMPRLIPGIHASAEIVAPPTEPIRAGETAAVSADIADTSRAPVPADAAGTITGHVRDVDSGNGLPYTNIVLYRMTSSGRIGQQEGGSIALTGGQYFVRVAPGMYEVRFLYLGYETFVARDVAVEPGTTTTLDVEMKIEPIELAALTVQATRVTDTERSQIAQKKRAVAVQEAITAEEISRSTDSDAAEALERVTGLSVVGGKFVFVRGLGDRYSSTTLNGAPVSSPEPGRNTVPLDIFPAAMLDNIVVQKTFTPEMSGNFGGGNIDIRTRRGVDERSFKQKISYGYSESVLRDDFYSYDGGGTDLLARDDGNRGFPRVLAPYSNRPFDVTSGPEEVAATYSFPNVWTPVRVEGPPNMSYGGLYSEGFRLGERPGSVLAALSYSHGAKTQSRYEVQSRSSLPVPPKQEAEVVEGERSVLLGITSAFVYEPWDGGSLQYNLLYTRSSEDLARTTLSSTDSDDDQFRAHRLRYVERSLLTHVLQARQVIGSGGSTLRWMISRSTADRNEPNNRLTRFLWSPNLGRRTTEDGEQYFTGGWGKPPDRGAFERLFGATDESQIAMKTDLELVLPERSWIKRKARFGVSYRRRERDESYRRFVVDVPVAAYEGTLSGQGEDLLDPTAFDDFAGSPGDFQTVELTNPFDAYTARQDVVGGYGKLEFDFFSRLLVSGGVRVESNEQTVVAITPGVEALGITPVDAKVSGEDVLPAANATFRFTDRIQAKVAYSQTVNRPELRELAPLRIYDFDVDQGTSGNPFLQPAEVEAYDARLEFYPGGRSYASVSLFDKTIDRAILVARSNRSGGQVTYFPTNANDGGSLEGWELEWRGPLADVASATRQAGTTGWWVLSRPLWLLGQIPGLDALARWAPSHRVHSAIDAPALRNWGFTFNYTSIESELLLDTARATAELRNTIDVDGNPEPVDPDALPQKNRLTGQADSALNLGVFYGNGRQDLSVMVKDFGLRQEVAADQIFTDPNLVVDAAVATKIGPSVRLKFTVEDIFPGDQRSYFGFVMVRDDGETLDTRSLARSAGRKYGLSVSYDF